MSYAIGDSVPARQVIDLDGARWSIPPEKGLLHVQFRRFAGCPICNLHVAEVRTRIDDIKAVGVQELVFFSASRRALQETQVALPFPIVPDLERVHYDEFGVTSSVTGLLQPATILGGVRGMFSLSRFPALEQADALMLNPAEFLIGVDGRILDAHYGTHPADQWSIDELLRRVSALKEPL